MATMHVVLLPSVIFPFQANLTKLDVVFRVSMADDVSSVHAQVKRLSIFVAAFKP